MISEAVLLLGLSVIASALTLLARWLLAERMRLGFLVSAANQVNWLAIIFLTGTYGLLLLNVASCAIAYRGWTNWGNHE